MKNCSISERYSTWNRTIEASWVSWGLLVDSLWLTSVQILSYTHDAASAQWETETKTKTRTRTELNLEFYLLDFVQLQLKEQGKQECFLFFLSGAWSQDTCLELGMSIKSFWRNFCPLTRRINYPFLLFFVFFFLGKCENLLRQVQNNDMQSNLRTPGHGRRVSDSPQEVAHSSLCVMDSKCPSPCSAGRA